MAESGLKVFIGTNFKVEGKDVLPSDANILSQPGVYFDERANFLTYGLNLHNYEWYYNYLNFMQVASTKNMNANPSYLLNLGYIPVVYLPSCCLQLTDSLMKVLEVNKVPHIKKAPTSFATKYCNIMTTDAWVSKMDVHEMLGVTPEKVTSEMLLRRLLFV